MVSIDDVSVKDVEEEVYDSDDEERKEKPEDWEDDDARWGNPPTVGKPTIVNAKILVGQLQDLDTVRGTLGIRSASTSTWSPPGSGCGAPGRIPGWPAGAGWIPSPLRCLHTLL